MNTAITTPLADATRARAVMLICALAALTFGAFAALGSEQSVATVGVALTFCVAAWILPLPWVALVLAALIPLQFYFPIANGLYLRGVLVFVVAAALRVFVLRTVQPDWRSAVSRLRSLPWLIPAALFIFAAFIAAINAPNQYAALKGILDWLPVFAAAFVIGEIVRSEQLAQQIVVVIVAAGVGEALIGLLQTALDLPSVIGILQSPISSLLYQPNLLNERLTDLSFNWTGYDRVLPFGTFINDIDYAIFLAAILTLVLALMLGEVTTADRQLPIADRNTQHGTRTTYHASYFLRLLLCAALFSVVLAQTLKGSGVLALAGGVGAVTLLHLPRWSPRALAIGALVLIAALALAAPFYGEFAQRVVFLIQRETGAITTSGRLAIWGQLLAFIPRRPWFGWGIDNSALLAEPMATLTGGMFVIHLTSAESAYVAALVETGVLGFAALLAFLIIVLARAIHHARSARAIGVAAAIVALAFGNLTMVGLTTYQNGPLLGVLIGLSFSSANEYGQEIH